MKACVVGGGSWGTALAVQLESAGHAVSLWVRDAELAERIHRTHVNDKYLPDVTLAPEISATPDLAAATRAAELVVIAVPSEFCREIYERLVPLLAADALVVSATKGFELDTTKRLSQVAREWLPERKIAVLSGPSFAHEVAALQPTAVVVASTEIGTAEEIQRAVSTRTFRAYSSDDVVGVEVGGALKNVIAIAAGIVAGLGFGHNTLAALVTRGLAEMTRLARAMGGQEETLSGLAGLGDLVLTSTGSLSRNRRVGEAIGRGQTLAEALRGTHMVAEGVRTTLAACALASTHAVEMPIAQAMRRVLHESFPARDAVLELMSRRLKRE